MTPAAATTPVVAPANIMKVMATICVALDRLLSPEYACQLVLVTKDTAVLKARSGVCAALPSALSGIQPCRRSSA